ncbi:hypothetical protein ABFX02_03G110400 [Erythranthe guttata]
MSEKGPDFYSHKSPSSSEVVDELKELWSMAFPITAMNILVYIRAVVSVVFLGRLGSLELAGGALSIGFTNITGYSVLVGLASGLEPVCSQAHGSKNFDLLSLSLHRMIFILSLATVPIALLWINLEPIMLFLGQDKEITSTAAVYCLYSLPDLLINTLLQPLRVYLRSQGVTKPQMWCTFVAVVFHVPLNYVLVGAGVKGVALASVLTNLHMLVLLMGYVCVYGRRGWGWKWGGGVVCGGGFWPLVEMAVASCAGICLEWWWYEIVTVMLGGGKPYKAKLAAIVALICAFGVGFINIIWTVIFREKWGELFTKDEMLKSLVSSVLPIIGLCELGNCPQTTGCGILRATARPVWAARINLGSFYFVGTPVALGLAFWLGFGFSGLWLGLLSAQAACGGSILYAVLCCTDWEGEAVKATKLTGLEMGIKCNSDGEDTNGLLAQSKDSLKIIN